MQIKKNIKNKTAVYDDDDAPGEFLTRSEIQKVMSTANLDGEDFDAEALLADLEPLEDLDDAEFGLPPIENPPTLEEILAANDDNDEDLEDNIDLDDAASSASTLPISQAYPNTLSVALRQLNNSATGDTLSVGSDSKSRGSSRSQKSLQNKKDKGSIMR